MNRIRKDSTMAFGKKKGQEPSAPPADAPAADKRKAPKKRKPAELLSSVINESAPGAAIDVLKRNDAFALPNGTAWVGLLLAVDDIGGLSQKHKGDATKGSLIELITADKIQAVATKAMLDEEFLGIVPSVASLERMEEYRLLTDTRYYWGVFRAEDGGQALVVDAIQAPQGSYADAVAISRGEKRLRDVLPEVWSWAGGEVSEPELSEFDRILVGAGAGVGASAAAGGIGGGPSGQRVGADLDPLAIDPLAGAVATDEPDFFGGADVDLSSGVVTDGEPPLTFDEAHFEAQIAATPSLEDADTADAAPSFDTSWQDDEVSSFDYAAEDEVDQALPAADEGYFQYLAENRDRVVDEQEVRDTIARRFLGNDLDLVVDLVEFDRVFGAEAGAIAIDIADGTTDWLGTQVAQLSRQANAELEALHRGHVDELRQLFVETMALHVEKTMVAVSTDAPGSQYHALMEGAKRDFEALRANSPEQVAALRRELTERFNAAADARAAQAAAHARAVYEDKNRPKLERDLAEVSLDFDRRLEEQYAYDQQTVLELRRKDANVRMDLGANRIFEHLREVQAQQRETERAALERWNATLIQFIDENRKSDIARAQALAEELSRSNQVAALQAQHDSQLATMRSEHAAREIELRSEMTRIRQEAEVELRSRRTEWESSLGVERERSSSTRDLVDQLKQQMKALDRHYETQYTARIKNLESDKQVIQAEHERTTTLQKRTNYVMIALAAVLCVSGIAVGVIAGWAWGHQQAAEYIPAGMALLGSLSL